MKNIKFLMFAIALFTFGLSLSSCGNNSSTKEATENADMTGKEYTSAYVCPMHCEGSGSDAAGKCPVCGMDYVANADAKKKEADGHEGHNH